eukprot:gene22754-28912_t
MVPILYQVAVSHLTLMVVFTVDSKYNNDIKPDNAADQLDLRRAPKGGGGGGGPPSATKIPKSTSAASGLSSVDMYNNSYSAFLYAQQLEMYNANNNNLLLQQQQQLAQLSAAGGGLNSSTGALPNQANQSALNAATAAVAASVGMDIGTSGATGTSSAGKNSDLTQQQLSMSSPAQTQQFQAAMINPPLKLTKKQREAAALQQAQIAAGFYPLGVGGMGLNNSGLSPIMFASNAGLGLNATSYFLQNSAANYLLGGANSTSGGGANITNSNGANTLPNTLQRSVSDGGISSTAGISGDFALSVQNTQNTGANSGGHAIRLPKVEMLNNSRLLLQPNNSANNINSNMSNNTANMMYANMSQLTPQQQQSVLSNSLYPLNSMLVSGTSPQTTNTNLGGNSHSSTGAMSKKAPSSLYAQISGKTQSQVQQLSNNNVQNSAAYNINNNINNNNNYMQQQQPPGGGGGGGGGGGVNAVNNDINHATLMSGMNNSNSIANNGTKPTLNRASSLNPAASTIPNSNNNANLNPTNSNSSNSSKPKKGKQSSSSSQGGSGGTGGGGGSYSSAPPPHTPSLALNSASNTTNNNTSNVLSTTQLSSSTTTAGNTSLNTSSNMAYTSTAVGGGSDMLLQQQQLQLQRMSSDNSGAMNANNTAPGAFPKNAPNSVSATGGASNLNNSVPAISGAANINSSAGGGGGYTKPPKEPKVKGERQAGGRGGVRANKDRSNSSTSVTSDGNNAQLSSGALGSAGHMLGNTPYATSSSASSSIHGSGVVTMGLSGGVVVNSSVSGLGGVSINRDGSYTTTSYSGTAGVGGVASGAMSGGMSTLTGSSYLAASSTSSSKADKEESVTSLNKRRDAAMAKLMSLENAKMLGRKSISQSLQSAIQPRRKVLWDYVCEEVQFMAIDFRQELKWKMAVCRSIAVECAEAVLSKKKTSRHASSQQEHDHLHSETYKESLAIARQNATKISSLVSSRWLAVEQTSLALLKGHGSDSGADFNLSPVLRHSMYKRIEELLLCESANYTPSHASRVALELSYSALFAPTVPVTLYEVGPLSALTPAVEIVLSAKQLTSLIDKTIDKVFKHKPVVVAFNAQSEALGQKMQVDDEEEEEEEERSLQLQLHQHQIIEAIENLQETHSFGSAVVVKQSSVGVTLSLVELTSQWLTPPQVDEVGDEVVSTPGDDVAMTVDNTPKVSQSRVVLLVVPRHRMFKYISYYTAKQPHVTLLTYTANAETSELIASQWRLLCAESVSAVVLVCAENMPHFLENGHFLSSLVRSFLVGVMVDIRCPAEPVVSTAVKRSKPAKHKNDQSTAHKNAVDLCKFLIPLVSALAPRKHTVQRVIVNNAPFNSAQHDVTGILAFLVPQITYLQWSGKYPIIKHVNKTQAPSSPLTVREHNSKTPAFMPNNEKIPEKDVKKSSFLPLDSVSQSDTETDFPHTDYVNRNTVNQLLCNISVALKTVAVPQSPQTQSPLTVVEEVVAVEMTETQSAKYRALCALLTSTNSSTTGTSVATHTNKFSDGSSTQRTAEMVLLLSRVCFDERLVSVTHESGHVNTSSLHAFTASPYSPYAPYNPSLFAGGQLPVNYNQTGSSSVYSPVATAALSVAATSGMLKQVDQKSATSAVEVSPLLLSGSVYTSNHGVTTGGLNAAPVPFVIPRHMSFDNHSSGSTGGLPSTHSTNSISSGGSGGSVGGGVATTVSSSSASYFPPMSDASLSPRQTSHIQYSPSLSSSVYPLTTASINNNSYSLSNYTSNLTIPPYAGGSTVTNTINSAVKREISVFCGHRAQNANLAGDANAAGGKLGALLAALSKHSDEKVLVLVETSEELQITSQFLGHHSVSHLNTVRPSQSDLGDCDDTLGEMEANINDIYSQSVVSQFNNAMHSTDHIKSRSNVLLTTNSVFHAKSSGRVLPSTLVTDVVLVLSTQWLPTNHTNNNNITQNTTLQMIKDSFFITSHARKSPMKVLHFVCQNTVEEAMSRRCGNFLSLQGATLGDVHLVNQFSELVVLPSKATTSELNAVRSDLSTAVIHSDILLLKAPIFASIVTTSAIIDSSNAMATLNLKGINTSQSVTASTSISVASTPPTVSVPPVAVAPRGSGFGGKGTIILGPAGATSYVKSSGDDNAQSAPTNSSKAKKSSVELATSSARHSMLKYVQALGAVFEKTRTEFVSRNKVIKSNFNSPNTSASSQVVSPPLASPTITTSNTTALSTIKSEGEDTSSAANTFTTNTTDVVHTSSMTYDHTVTSDDECHEVETEECLDLCRNKILLTTLKSTLQHLIQNSCDMLTEKVATQASSTTQNVMSNVHVASQITLLTQYAQKLTRRVSLVERNLDLCTCNNSYDFLCDDDAYCYDVGNTKHKRGKMLTATERNRLLVAGETVTHVIRNDHSPHKNQHVPNLRNYLLPIANNIYHQTLINSTNAASTNTVSPLTKPRCLYTFTELLMEQQRQGIEMDSHLFVNPLMTATRSDVYHTPSYTQTTTDVNRSGNSVSIQYLLVKGAKGQHPNIRKIRQPYTKKKNADGSLANPAAGTNPPPPNNNSNTTSNTTSSGGDFQQGGGYTQQSNQSIAAQIANSYNNNPNSNPKSISGPNTASLPIMSSPVKFEDSTYSKYSEYSNSSNNMFQSQDSESYFNTNEQNDYRPPPPAPTNKRQRERAKNEFKTQQVLNEFHNNTIKMEQALSPQNTPSSNTQQNNCSNKYNNSQYTQSQSNTSTTSSQQMFSDFDRPSSTNAFDIAERTMAQQQNSHSRNHLSSPSTHIKVEQHSNANNSASSTNGSSSSSGSSNKKKHRKYSHGSANNLNLEEAAHGIQQEFLSNHYQQQLQTQQNGTSPRTVPPTAKASQQQAVNSFDSCSHASKGSSNGGVNESKHSSAFQPIDYQQTTNTRCSPQVALFAAHDSSHYNSTASESISHKNDNHMKSATPQSPRHISTPNKTNNQNTLLRTPPNTTATTSSNTPLSSVGGGGGKRSRSGSNANGLRGGGGEVEGEGGEWNSLEDDLIICMQQAIHDQDFSRTVVFLNKSNSKRHSAKIRTAEEALRRYGELCASGRAETRLQDYKIRNTIESLMKSVSKEKTANESPAAGGHHTRHSEEQQQGGDRGSDDGSNEGNEGEGAGSGGEYFTESPDSV